MATLLTEIGIVPVFICALILIPELIRFTKWIIDIVKAHNTNQKNSFEAGKASQKEADAQGAYLEELEIREDRLEAQLKQQQDDISKLRAQMDDVMLNNNLEIKAKIKEALDKVCATRTIDWYDLQILEERFNIYERNGGNSWAKDMMKIIRKAAVTVEPIGDNDEANED